MERVSVFGGRHDGRRMERVILVVHKGSGGLERLVVGVVHKASGGYRSFSDSSSRPVPPHKENDGSNEEDSSGDD